MHNPCCTSHPVAQGQRPGTGASEFIPILYEWLHNWDDPKGHRYPSMKGRPDSLFECHSRVTGGPDPARADSTQIACLARTNAVRKRVDSRQLAFDFAWNFDDNQGREKTPCRWLHN